MTALYSDVSSDFPTDNPIITNIDAIYQSLDELFNTEKDDRLFEDIFADLEPILFEPMNEDTADAILTRITTAVQKHEPRVNLLLGRCDVEPIYDSNKYRVTLIFKIRGLDEEEFEFSGELQGVR